MAEIIYNMRDDDIFKMSNGFGFVGYLKNRTTTVATTLTGLLHPQLWVHGLWGVTIVIIVPPPPSPQSHHPVCNVPRSNRNMQHLSTYARVARNDACQAVELKLRFSSVKSYDNNSTTDTWASLHTMHAISAAVHHSHHSAFIMCRLLWPENSLSWLQCYVYIILTVSSISDLLNFLSSFETLLALTSWVYSGAIQLSSGGMTFMIYLCLIFSSSRKVSTNQQTVRLFSCVARSFPCVACAMPLVPGPTFHQ